MMAVDLKLLLGRQRVGTPYKALHFLESDKAIFIDVYRFEDAFVSCLKLL